LLLRVVLKREHKAWDASGITHTLAAIRSLTNATKCNAKCKEM